MSQSIVIIGAGPAGLTAAYELLKKGQVSVTILEATGEIGGISRTKNYKGNRMDIGGHRFFSKSDKAMDFWKEIMPLEDRERGISPDQADLLFLIRHRLSRILFLRKFFDYPVTLNGSTIRGLGFSRLMKIGVSYLKICFRPVKDIDSLEKFFISRFGVELYETFFKDYTEKVWGVPCSQISPDWGAQRVKGLSVSKALLHSLKKPFLKKSTVNGKKVETSLIESFMYPKYGPGQLWEEVARRVVAMGGEIRFGQRVDQVSVENGRIVSVAAVDENGVRSAVEGDYFLSTMPVRDLIGAMGPAAPEKVKEVAEGLVYRDFMTVGLLLDSPYMVKDPDTVFMGLEYFCDEGDEMWNTPDQEFIDFAVGELEKLGIVERSHVKDAVLIRVPKAYPAYFGTYGQFGEIRKFTDSLENLFLLGRNGQHRYNNMDHSMLTAMAAAEAILSGNVRDKSPVWEINTEEEYHEEKQGA